MNISIIFGFFLCFPMGSVKPEHIKNNRTDRFTVLDLWQKEKLHYILGSTSSTKSDVCAAIPTIYVLRRGLDRQSMRMDFLSSPKESLKYGIHLYYGRFHLYYLIAVLIYIDALTLAQLFRALF